MIAPQSLRTIVQHRKQIAGMKKTASSRRIDAKTLKRARRRHVPGFTLIEMLVVLTIIGLIAGLVGPRVLGYVDSSREKTANLQISALSSALDLYFVDVGRYPSGSEGLDALVRRPASAQNWNGPYVRDGAIPLDPWGNPYEYSISGPNGPFSVKSPGLAQNQ